LFQENENFTKEYSFFGWAHFFEILHARQNDETLPNFRKPKHLMECENKELKERTKDQATK
jgi:hypothetical protein